MSASAAQRYMRTHRASPKDEKGPGLNESERAALRRIRLEARAAGSTLASGGKGGLPPSLVLGVMRRDEFKCKVCGERGTGENGVQVHHKGGVVESKWLSKKGHNNDPNNLVTICERCHDNVHEKARDEGTDSSQVEPFGDKE